VGLNYLANGSDCLFNSNLDHFFLCAASIMSLTYLGVFADVAFAKQIISSCQLPLFSLLP
jgi:hypothetical protein